MPRTMIVPVDGSEPAERALRVAQELAAHLEACDVLVMTASATDDPDRRAYLQALVEAAAAPGVRSELVDDAEPADAIARLAETIPDAMVCIATHGRGRVTAPFLGSVATEVLRRINTPILLVGPHCETSWWHDPAKLVTCWAGEESDPILPCARQWAGVLGIELWLESVFHPLDTHMAQDPHAEFESALARLGSDVEVHLLPLRDADPAGAIVRSARELPATLLAMTTRARTGLVRAALGSVTMQVVHDSPCPVLVVGRPR
jgi:nucleotide-binding universal stress UspA family protein